MPPEDSPSRRVLAARIRIDHMNAEGTVFPRRAWYAASVTEFLQSSVDSILGRLAANSDFAIDTSQRDAWIRQVEILQFALRGLSGEVLLEFNIPRMGRRIDVVLLVGPVVFAIEFKVGEKTFDRSAVDQVWDYSLDLKNFHEASHDVSIVPILIATEAAESEPITLRTRCGQSLPPDFGECRRLSRRSSTWLYKASPALRSTTNNGLARLITQRRQSWRPRALFTLNTRLKPSLVMTLALRTCMSLRDVSKNWWMKRERKDAS